jgi:signal transduction histidine kinase
MLFPRLTIAFLTIFLLLQQQPASAQAEEGHHFYLFEDSSKNLSPAQAADYFRDGKFKRMQSTEKNVGFTRSVFWLGYLNPAPRPQDSLLLFIGHQHINRIHFYHVTDTGLSLQWITGDYYPFKQRPVYATGFYFPLRERGLYLARIDKSNESLQLSFAVSSPIDVFRAESYQKTILALFTGMIFLLVIFGIYLFIISGDRIYIFYILYMAAGWLWVLANSGHGFQYLWPNQPWFASKARPVFAIAPLIFSMLFLKRYIGGIRSRRTLFLVKIVNWTLFACIIGIFLFREDGYNSNWWYYIQFFIPLISLVFVVITLFVLVSAVIKGNRLAMFYLAAIGVLFTFVMLQILFSLGKLEGSDNFFSHFGLSVGFVVEAIILTAGLVYRFNQYRLDKENLLIRINKQQKENTRMILEVQEAERSQVANQLHDVAGSLLSAARLNLTSLKEKDKTLNEKSVYHLQKTEEAISMVSEMVRNLSHALSPVMLEKVGFQASLEKIISIVNASGKIKIELMVAGFDHYDPALGKYYTALYSIIYELLNNIVKHSGAKNVLLQVSNYDDCFSLVSEDDGIGMEVNKIGKMNSLGLSGIQAKIDFFGGRIAFDANQPTGLVVTIEIPYNHEEK